MTMSLLRGATTGSALALGLLLCVGCSGAEPTGTAATGSASTSPSPSAAATSSSPSPTPSSTTSFDREATPATTSGSLRRASLPRPAVLGKGWGTRVDPGSQEDGYTGNGTPTVARDPGDTVAALRPIGCAEEAAYAEQLPVPAHALEVDYRHRGTGAHGIGLALEFRDVATAEDFFDVYSRSLGLCSSGAGGTTRVTVQASPGADAIATVTVDPFEQSTWRELAERSGRFVRLLAIEGTRAPVRDWPTVLVALRG
jgi:hypothetical protein